ncbi:uncharacterized protein LOC125196303 isoform X1 [Salvia hispanica]|uniref:uncharacterized protein LOC125196303 isoform X1 n=1 Tax=Salvia hispanica TaxID=49212 RepID=UPI0020095EDB|nr:uncharacterized protein LOC125196303 isoform X1 [Salvia hispanica]
MELTAKYGSLCPQVSNTRGLYKQPHPHSPPLSFRHHKFTQNQRVQQGNEKSKKARRGSDEAGKTAANREDSPSEVERQKDGVMIGVDVIKLISHDSCVHTRSRLVERRWAVGGVETVESNKMDGWDFECSRVLVHGFASLGMLPLNILKLITFGCFKLISSN